MLCPCCRLFIRNSLLVAEDDPLSLMEAAHIIFRGQQGRAMQRRSQV